MKVVALLNEKGGSGKTTISLNLATALHRQGRKVVLVDADPQGTLRDWRAALNSRIPPSRVSACRKANTWNKAK